MGFGPLEKFSRSEEDFVLPHVTPSLKFDFSLMDAVVYTTLQSLGRRLGLELSDKAPFVCQDDPADRREHL